MKIQKKFLIVGSQFTIPRRLFFLRKCFEHQLIGILTYRFWNYIFPLKPNIRRAKLASFIISVLFLTGCSIQYPVWLGDEGVARMCMQSGIYDYTHNGVTKQFSVQITDPLDMYKACGTSRDGRHAQACIIDNYTIFATPGRNCTKSMAHELSHGFGMHFVDRPLTRSGDSHG